MTDPIYEAAMAEAVGLGLMSDGHATDRCQCPTCGEVFSTEGNFDRHLARDRNREDYTGPWCRHPSKVGLVCTGKVWHRPGSEGALVAFRASRLDRGSAPHRGKAPPPWKGPAKVSVVATVTETIALLRAEGKEDDEIGRMFAQAKVPLPEGNFHHHSKLTVRALAGEDASGSPLDGRARR